MASDAFELPLFEQVADAVYSLMPDQQDQLRLRWHRRGVKAWFDSEKPGREHYEAQLIARRYVDGQDGVAVEVGFHAEHKEVDKNEQVVQHLGSREKAWRKELGTEAELGVFYGADNWRRLSEAWIEPDLEEPGLAFEVAARLVDYLRTIEPILSSNGPNA